MQSARGFGAMDDDDAVEDATPQEVVFEFGLSDAASATEVARQASDLGYTVEMRAPDDDETFYEVICSRVMPSTEAEVERARAELEALAEKLGCLDIDEEMEGEPG